MGKYAMAGVGYGFAIDENGNRFMSSKTFTDSGFSASTTLEEIRGGFSNALQSMYAHTSAFEVTAKDCLVDLDYIAAQVGGNVSAGGDVFITESVTTTVANKITVVGTPKAFAGYGIVGWYNIPGSDVEHTITFVGKDATVANLAVGTTLCVTYVQTDDTARSFEVASSFVPKVVHYVFTLPLLSAGASADITSQSKVGEWIVDVPKLMFKGSFEMNATSAGTVGGDISGKALASGAVTCSGNQIYATITERIYDKGTYDDVSEIVITDSTLDLAPTETQTLVVKALYNDNRTPNVVPNSDLTFASDKTTVATVSTDGVVTAVATGSAIITATLTSKTSLSSVAVAKVS